MQALPQITGEMANPGWVLVAVAAGLLGVAVLVLGRIRRFQARPLRICFFLSILAHLLLLAAFYVSRVLDMPYIPGSQLTFVVDLSLEEVDGTGASDATSKPPALSTVPPALQADSLSAIAEIDQPQPDASATPLPSVPSDPNSSSAQDNRLNRDELQAPPLLDPPAPTNEAEEPDRPVVDLVKSAPQEPVMAQSDEAPQPGKDADDSEPTRDVAVEDVSTLPAEPAMNVDRSSAAEGDLAKADQPQVNQNGWSSTTSDPSNTASSRVPGRYRDRLNRPSAEDLKRRGGSPISEQAVESALQWLAKNQSADGRWDPRRHGAGQGGWIDGQHRGSTGLDADTGITGLALLAFLASGHSHQSGAYQENVQGGLDFLISRQSANGNLGADASIYAQMYCHGIATLAVCEALALTGDNSLKPTAQWAITYTVESQHHVTGGWRYRPGDPGDMSQFGWQLMAIVSAREAGLDVPDRVDLGMSRFLESVQCGHAGGLAGYRPGFPASHSMTAEALACRWFLGIRDAGKDQEAVQYIMTMKPGEGPLNFYYWYYATMALRQFDSPEWPEWNRALQHQLLKTQRHTGTLAGSWDPTSVWGKVGGRVYTTAMATLCLESYYRYAR